MTAQPILNIKTSGFVPSAKSSKYLELLSMVEVVDHMFVDYMMKMCDVMKLKRLLFSIFNYISTERYHLTPPPIHTGIEILLKTVCGVWYPV